MAIDKSLNQYYDESQIDPDAPDIEVEFDLFGADEGLGSNVIEFEDGSAEVGDFDEVPADLPPMDQIPHTSNLVAYFDNKELTDMASMIREAWETDNESRKDWTDTYTKGLDLLGMKIEERTEPFDGACGVHHPLLAEAVVQFQAQAYKELLPAGGPVSTKVLGSETNERVAQAERVKNYLNYLVMDLMEEYDPDMDQLLFYLPLSGSAFKKSYFDPLRGQPRTDFITADHVTIPYSATSLKSTPRIIHDFPISGNDILKYQEKGFYSDEHELPESGTVKTNDATEATDSIVGVTKTEFEHDNNYLFLEAHLNLDNDQLVTAGGVARPFIVTMDEESGTILAIRRNWKQDDPLYTRLDHFVHYKFLPGLGFYGFGLIHMIGGLTKAATAILRELIDAGTFANLPAGFKSKDMRVAGADEPLQPGEFRDVDMIGGAIRDAIIPLPYKEPSAVLFGLLGSLVESGQRFASIADMQVGDTSGQQQPVGTTIAVLERGTKVMSSIHKRLHRAQKNEFRIIARIVHESLPEGQSYPFAVKGQEGMIAKEDFDDRVDVIPVSDPNIFSMAQRIMLAQQQLMMATQAPELHNLKEAYRRMYKAMNIDDIESILMPDKKPQNMTPMQENRNVMMNIKLVAIPEMNHEAHIQGHIAMLSHPMIKSNVEFASNLVQDIINHISLVAKQQSDQAAQAGQQVDPVTIELQLFNQLLPQISVMPENPLEQLQDRQLDIDARDNEMKHVVDLIGIDSKERIEDGKLEGDIIKADINERLETVKATAAGLSRTPGSEN